MLCGTASRFVHVTTSPVAICNEGGENAKSLIVTAEVAATAYMGATRAVHPRSANASADRTTERTTPSLETMNATTSRISIATLRDALAARGTALDATQIDRFERYGALLREWNERMNLTAITEPEEIVTKHFLDSLTLLLARPLAPSARVVDVGSGAGFPGVPLAIARPDARVTLVESVAKKVRFLEELTRALGLANVTVVHARGEELAHEPSRRERYDIAVARALPGLAANLELLLPFCRVGGQAVAYKGGIDAELAAAQRAADALGGQLAEIVTTVSLGLGEPLPGRSLVFVAKRHRTPSRYPRGPAEAKRRPW